MDLALDTSLGNKEREPVLNVLEAFGLLVLPRVMWGSRSGTSSLLTGWPVRTLWRELGARLCVWLGLVSGNLVHWVMWQLWRKRMQH